MTHNQDKSSMLGQGVYIFIYLAVLTVLEFWIAKTFDATALLVVIAVTKAVLVVYFYMHIYKLNAESDDDVHSYAYKTATNRLGLWLFLISDTFVFGGLMAMRLNLLGLSHPNLSQLLGLTVTSVLLISSFFMNRGETLIQNGDRKGFVINTIITFILGLGFLLGVLFIEWPNAIREGILPNNGPGGAAFFMMTGMHALHVLTGLIFLLIVIRNANRGLYDEKHYPVEAAAVYWHFVDVVWIFFYPALYLIGTIIK